MQAALKGLAIAEKYNDYGTESSLCNNISKLLFDTKRYSEATEYSLKAVKLAEKIGDERMLGIAYINLANQYEDGRSAVVRAAPKAKRDRARSPDR